MGRSGLFRRAGHSPLAFRWISLAAILAGWVRPEFARGQNGAAPSPAPDLRANRVGGPIHLGDRLDDPAWRTADSIVELRQREPVEGAPATERTVLKVLRDDDALYVAVRAYDSDVREIRATQLRRDADLEVDDNITLLVDGFHDRRSGFVFRTNPNGAMWDAQFAGIWETTWHIDFMPRPHLLGIRQLDLQFPIPSWDTIAAETGSLFRTRDWETANFEWRPLGGTFQSGARFEVNIQRVFDAPPAPFEIFPGVTVAPGRYWWTRGELQYEMPKSHPVSLGGLVSLGGFFGGHDTAVEVQGEWRSGGRIVVGGLLSRSRVTLPEGSFTASRLTGRVEYALNTRTSFLGFGQYNTEDQRVDFNLRFWWIPRIGDDVYVVWNSGYTTDPTAPHRFPSWRTLRNPLNGALIVKAVHRFTP